MEPSSHLYYLNDGHHHTGTTEYPHNSAEQEGALSDQLMDDSSSSPEKENGSGKRAICCDEDDVTQDSSVDTTRPRKKAVSVPKVATQLMSFDRTTPLPVTTTCSISAATVSEDVLDQVIDDSWNSSEKENGNGKRENQDSLVDTTPRIKAKAASVPKVAKQRQSFDRATPLPVTTTTGKSADAVDELANLKKGYAELVTQYDTLLDAHQKLRNDYDKTLCDVQGGLATTSALAMTEEVLPRTDYPHNAEAEETLLDPLLDDSLCSPEKENGNGKCETLCDADDVTQDSSVDTTPRKKAAVPYPMLMDLTKRDDLPPPPTATTNIVQSEQTTMLPASSESFVTEQKMQWDENYKQVLTFAKENGHLKLTQKTTETRRLSQWLLRQKNRKVLATYESEQLALLEEYGYSNDSHQATEKTWRSFFDKLVEHKRIHGHTRVAKTDTKLHGWVSRQRRQEGRGRLLLERRDQLVEIGFEFQRDKPYSKKKQHTEQQEKKWDDMYIKLCEYHKQHGHCKVSYHDESNEGLSKWVARQRQVFGNGEMDEKRRQRLEDIGFSWRLQARVAVSSTGTQI
jgi:hypothetical protein